MAHSLILETIRQSRDVIGTPVEQLQINPQVPIASRTFPDQIDALSRMLGSFRNPVEEAPKKVGFQVLGSQEATHEDLHPASEQKQPAVRYIHSGIGSDNLIAQPRKRDVSVRQSGLSRSDLDTGASQATKGLRTFRDYDKPWLFYGGKPAVKNYAPHALSHKELTPYEQQQQRKQRLQLQRSQHVERKEQDRQLFKKFGVNPAAMTFDHKQRVKQELNKKAETERQLQEQHERQVWLDRQRPSDSDIIDEVFREINQDSFKVKGFTRVPYQELYRQKELVRNIVGHDIDLYNRVLYNDEDSGNETPAGLEMFKETRKRRQSSEDDIYKATLTILDAKNNYARYEPFE